MSVNSTNHPFNLHSLTTYLCL